MRRITLAPRLLAISFGLLFPAAGHATLLFGSVAIVGSSTVSSSSIVFSPGTFSILNATGSFTSLGLTTGTIMSIFNPPYVPGTITPTPDFMTFIAAPNITITLMELPPGVDGVAGCGLTPAAGGQFCAPAGSPFNLNNTSATSSTASFNVIGLEVDSLTSTSTAIDGVFTVQFNVPYQSLLATMNGGGTMTTSYSASFATVVPEPGTGLMFGLGIFLVGGSLHFLRRKSSRLN